MKVKELMTTPVEACQPDTDLAKATRMMWDRDCGFLPVVNAAGTVVGAVTDRDICVAASTRRRLPEHISAQEVMHTPVHACLPDDAIEDVLDTMKKFLVRRLPVIDDRGALKGVISMNDIVIAAEDRKTPSAKVVLSTQAAICAHRHAPVAV